MQNQALREAHAEVEAGLERYADLYDFAPAGYFTLARDGAIRELNLAGAQLLGAERARLVGRRFGVFVAEASRPEFNRLLEQTFTSTTKQSCEVELAIEGRPRLVAAVRATLSPDGQACRVVVVDITERKRARGGASRERGALSAARRGGQGLRDLLARSRGAGHELERGCPGAQGLHVRRDPRAALLRVLPGRGA